MKLVIDANVVISALIADSKTRELIVSGEQTEAHFQQWIDIQFAFNRAVQPEGDARHLTVRCYRLQLESEGETVSVYDIGGDEQGIKLERGYFDPETAESGTYRWFGGDATITRLSLPKTEIDRADTLAIEAAPIESDLVGTVSLGGTTVGEIQFDETEKQWYRVPI